MRYENIVHLKRMISTYFGDIEDLLNELEDFSLSPMNSSFLKQECDKCANAAFTYFLAGYAVCEVKTRLKLIYKAVDVDMVVDDTYRIFENRITPQRIFAAQAMKKADVSTKKIAQILGLSVPTVLKYLSKTDIS